MSELVPKLFLTYPTRKLTWSVADTLADISKYSPKLSDGGVVAWTAHTKANRKAEERTMTFTVKAQVLKAQGEAAEAEKDEL